MSLMAAVPEVSIAWSSPAITDRAEAGPQDLQALLLDRGATFFFLEGHGDIGVG